MTKTGKIITATILTIATIGLVVFAIKKDIKPKTLQTNADYQFIRAKKSEYDSNYFDTTILTEDLYQFEYEENDIKYTAFTRIQTEIRTFLTSANSTRIIINVQPKSIQIYETINAVTNIYTLEPKNSQEWPSRTVFYDHILDKAIPYSSNLDMSRFYYYNQNNQESIELDFELAYDYNTEIEILHEDEWEIEIEPIQLNYEELILYDYQDADTLNSFMTTYNTITHTYSDGYNTGHENGYTEGWNNSDAFNHPIALQPLMLNILTMPFTFISQAFDVTLWPNTAYEFNIANFIKSLIAIATILFIIKMFTSGFSIIGNFTKNTEQEINMRSDNRKSRLAWKAQKIANKSNKMKKEE